MKKQVKTALIAAISLAFLAGDCPVEAKHPFKRALKATVALPVCLVVGVAVGVTVGAVGALVGPAIWVDLVRTDAALDRLEDERLAAEAAKDQAN